MIGLLSNRFVGLLFGVPVFRYVAWLSLTAMGAVPPAARLGHADCLIRAKVLRLLGS